MEKKCNGVVTQHVVADADADDALPSLEELLGSKNWEGLLDPLDLSLRRFILRCGDFCQCTYDAFDGDKNSEYFGSSRYGKKTFFDKVKFEFASAYQVSSFLYATSTVELIGITWDKETNFIGYIATSTDAVSQILGRREIYVVWRGTESNTEWFDNFHVNPVSAAPLLPNGGAGEDAVPNVMNGWLIMYMSSNPSSRFGKMSARDQLQTKIRQLIEEDFKGEKVSIVVTGHSLGASLAVLSAFDLVENGVRDIPVSVVTFGCPRVGDSNFTKWVERYSNLHILRVNNKQDIIPQLPPEILGYTDAGVVLEMDPTKSPYLRIFPPKSLHDAVFNRHDMQGILHMVTGWHGPNHKFKQVVKRCLALVNKGSALLKDELKIPDHWWVIENKGMVLNDKGDWVLAPPLDEDIPVPEF